MKRLILILLTSCGAVYAQQNALLLPWTPQQFTNTNGTVLANGKVCTYLAGTSTGVATYTDSTASVANNIPPNAILLDSTGRPTSGGIWLKPTQAYKIIVLTAGSDSTCNTGVTIKSQDNVGISASVSANNTFTGTNTFSGVATFTGAAPGIAACRIENVRYVDAANSCGWSGAAFANWMNSAMLDLGSSGGVVEVTSVAPITSNPFSGVTAPIYVQFLSPGTMTTTVPIVLGANQWLTGMGVQTPQIMAVAGFPSGRAIIEVGSGVEIHNAFVRDLSVNCGTVTGCSGIVFDGAQNPSGIVNVTIQNYTQDGVRLQQTSAATSAISLRDVWAYSPTSSSPTGSGLNVIAATNYYVENFIQASNHTFTGPQAFLLQSCVQFCTLKNVAGEGVTDVVKVTSTNGTWTMEGVAGLSVTNVVHFTAGTGNYVLHNITKGAMATNTLQDDNRSYTVTGNIMLQVVAGGATKDDWGSPTNIGWIRSPTTAVSAVDQIQLPAGFGGANQVYLVKDNLGNTMWEVSMDGRIIMHGNAAAAANNLLLDAPITAVRTLHFPDVNGTIIANTCSTSQKSETAADANVLTCVIAGAAGTYRIHFVMSLSAANAATLGWTATWTDSNGNAQTPANLSLFQEATGTPATTFTTSAAGNYYGFADVDVNNAGTSIVVKLTFSGTSFTGKVSTTVERLI